MSKEILAKIADYLASQMSLNLGTVTADGKPIVHTMGYASEGAVVYFATSKESRKAQNMINNPAVAYTVDQDTYESFGKIQGIQAMGKAIVLEDPKDLEKARGLLFKKFPQMANMPAMPGTVVFKIEPTEIYFLDYTVSFGHRDHVVF